MIKTILHKIYIYLTLNIIGLICAIEIYNANNYIAGSTMILFISVSLLKLLYKFIKINKLQYSKIAIK